MCIRTDTLPFVGQGCESEGGMEPLYPYIETLLTKPDWRRSLKYKRHHFEKAANEPDERKRLETLRELDLVREAIELCLRDGDLVEVDKRLAYPGSVIAHGPSPSEEPEDGASAVVRAETRDTGDAGDAVEDKDDDEDAVNSLWGSDGTDGYVPANRQKMDVDEAAQTGSSASRHRIATTDDDATAVDDKFAQLEARLSKYEEEARRKDEQIANLTALVEAIQPKLEQQQADRDRMQEMLTRQTELMEKMTSNQPADSPAGQHSKDIEIMRLADNIARMDNALKAQMNANKQRNEAVHRNTHQFSQLELEFRRMAPLVYADNEEFRLLAADFADLRKDDAARAEKIDWYTHSVKQLAATVSDLKKNGQFTSMTISAAQASLSTLNEIVRRLQTSVARQEDELVTLRPRSMSPRPASLDHDLARPRFVSDAHRPQFDRVRSWRLHDNDTASASAAATPIPRNTDDPPLVSAAQDAYRPSQ